jgi:hypothetical protein
MFKIRNLLKIKGWKVYADKMSVCKDIYYSIRDNMIYKSMSIMYPFPSIHIRYACYSM